MEEPVAGHAFGRTVLVCLPRTGEWAPGFVRVLAAHGKWAIPKRLGTLLGIRTDSAELYFDLLRANAVRVALRAVLILAVALDVGSIWVLYMIVFGLDIAETVYDTSAWSILPRIVERDQLRGPTLACSRPSRRPTSSPAPPLTGLLVAAGVAATFAAQAALWAVALVALLLVRGSFGRHPYRRTGLRADIAEGDALPVAAPPAANARRPDRGVQLRGERRIHHIRPVRGRLGVRHGAFRAGLRHPVDHHSRGYSARFTHRRTGRTDARKS